MALFKGMLFAGIILSTITAAKVAPSPGKFSDTIPFYAMGIVLTLGGILGIRRREEIERGEDGYEYAPLNQTWKSLLCDLETLLMELEEEVDELSEDALCARVSLIQEVALAPFFETKPDLLNEEPKLGPELIMQAACVDRLLNRVWSAAADGYIEESIKSFKQAKTAFDQSPIQDHLS